MNPEPYSGWNTGNTFKEHIMASPKAEFIVENLISKIYQKKYNDSKLHSERELASLYHVSRYTTQKVMKQLIDMGLFCTGGRLSDLPLYDQLQSDPAHAGGCRTVKLQGKYSRLSDPIQRLSQRQRPLWFINLLAVDIFC